MSPCSCDRGGIRPGFLKVIFLLLVEHLLAQECYFASTGQEEGSETCGLCAEASAVAVAQLENFNTQSQEI